MTSGWQRREEILDVVGRLISEVGVGASVHEMARACGIQPGTLYHHFGSKEGLLRALVARFDRELQAVVARADDDPSPGRGPVRVLELARALADVATRHRGALLLAMYGPLGDDGRANTTPTPPSVELAMREALEACRDGGSLRAEVDVALLADLLCVSMLHLGLDLFPDDRWRDQIASTRARLLLDGIATEPASDIALDGSAAMAAAVEAIAAWGSTPEELDPRGVELTGVATAAFARNGYRRTTMRDIAAAADLSTATLVFRRFPTKDALFGAILRSYTSKHAPAWRSVLSSASSPLEKIDAILWVDICLVDRFVDEWNAMLAWLRESPPRSSDGSWTYPARLRDLEALVRHGVQRDELRFPAPRTAVQARALAGLLYLPENIIRGAGGPQRALRFCRRSTIAGALE